MLWEDDGHGELVVNAYICLKDAPSPGGMLEQLQKRSKLTDVGLATQDVFIVFEDLLNYA